jgi:hypothetical protein
MPIMSITFYMVIIRIAINRNTPSYLSTTHGISSEADQRNLRQCRHTADENTPDLFLLKNEVPEQHRMSRVAFGIKHTVAACCTT